MHRSGSSATMGILRILGVDIGDDLGGQNAFNPKGYLENQEFYRFEQKILRNSQGRWDIIVPEEKLYKTFKFYEKEFKLLIKKFNRNSLWGYKAIRGGLFPETWLKIPNLHLIICLRSPEAIIASLKRRNRFGKKQTLWLWSTYYFRIFRFLSRHPIPFIIINFDDLVDKPGRVMKKLAKFLEIEISEKQVKQGKLWIEKRLRHFKEGKE